MQGREGMSEVGYSDSLASKNRDLQNTEQVLRKDVA